MSLVDKRKILSDFIRNNPHSTYVQIRKSTKIKVERVFGNMKQAYQYAGVSLPVNLTKRSLDYQKSVVLDYIRKNPSATITQIQNKTRTNIPRVFRTIERAFKEAGILYHPKDVTSGVCSSYVVERCHAYEQKILAELSKTGIVRKHVRTINGIADGVLDVNGHQFVVEIKDFEARNNITKSQIMQLIRYMQALQICDGLLICPKQSLPGKNSRYLYIENLKIQVLADDQIGDVV